MKKVYFIAILIVILLPCNSLKAQKKNQKADTIATVKLDATTDQTNAVNKENKLIEHLTKDSFKASVWNYEKNPQQWIYEGSKPCIIDFYASWCGPCRMLAPNLEQVAEQYKKQIVIYKVDIQQEKELASIFGVKSIPALLFIPSSSQQPQMAVGYKTKEALEEIVKNFLIVDKK